MRHTDTGLLPETTRPSILPKKVIYLLVRARTSPKIVHWTFLLFVFAIPLETINREAIPGAASLSRLAGLLFFSTCLFYRKVCFRRPLPAVWWFAGYVYVVGLNGAFIPEPLVNDLIVRCQTLIQLLVLCWLGSTLLQEEKLLRHTLLVFSMAMLLAAAGMLLGLPGFARSVGRTRLTVDNLNADAATLLMAMGAHSVIGLGLGIEQTLRNIWIRVTFMAMSLLPLTAMVYTGTRGGIIAFMVGAAVYVLPYGGSKRKMAAILMATIAVVCVVYTIVNNQETLSRFEKSYETGDSSGRNRIYTAAIEMISEKPLLGWRPIVFTYELGPRAGWVNQDPHNLVFYLLLEGGLLGATPFLMGLGLCVRAAWTARVGSLGFFPLVWLITMLCTSMAITPIHMKVLWLVFIVSLASGASTVKRSKRKNLMIRTM